MASNAEFRVERRQSSRIDVEGEARLRPNEWSQLQVRVTNLSREGFRAVCEAALKVGSYVALEIPGVGIVEARIIWRKSEDIGGRFIWPIDPTHSAWVSLPDGDPDALPQ